MSSILRERTKQKVLSPTAGRSRVHESETKRKVIVAMVGWYKTSGQNDDHQDGTYVTGHWNQYYSEEAQDCE